MSPDETIPCVGCKQTRSATIGKLAEALCKAQASMNGAVKDSANPFYKSKYADLASVWDACRGPLSSNGLAVIQTTVPSANGKVGVETILAHQSGEWISGLLEMTPVKADPQGVGSAITYARRYGLQAIVGIAPEDDDGNAASGKCRVGDDGAQYWPEPSPNQPEREVTYPKSLTKAELAEKKAKGELRQRPAPVRDTSWLEEREPEDGDLEPVLAASVKAIVEGEGTFQERLDKVRRDVEEKIASEASASSKGSRIPAPLGTAGDTGSTPVADSESMFLGNCELKGCEALLVTAKSDSKDNPGREYVVCHYAHQERAKLRKAGKSEAEIGVTLKGHTRRWKGAKERATP